MAPVAVRMLAWLALGPSAAAMTSSPFASSVVEYEPGATPTPGYTLAASALGPPERFTGEGVFPSVVSPFSPPFGIDEIVSISPGGHLTLEFSQPITNDANNPFGIDLLIFNNVGFIDGAFPEGVAVGIFGADGGSVEVSADGDNWIAIAGVFADALMPTLGYLDSGPYATVPGSILSDFTRPVDPGLSLEHLRGLDHAAVRSRYYGGGGGAGIDIAPTGVAAISFVRIANPSGALENIEIDAVADASPRLPGDVDFNNVVNIDDLLAVIAGWGQRVPGSPPTDFNNNGLVDIDDLLVVIGGWTGGGGA